MEEYMIEMNPMEEFYIEKDICLVYELANDFESDIAASFLRLAEKIKNDGKKRDCYGIVISEKNVMQYRAAYTESNSGEGIALRIPTIVIPRGNYYSIRMEDWSKKLLQIGPTFDQLLQSGKVDLKSPCIEYYKTERELICMIKSSE
jgi:hypothetical protein